jgi:hypothetical protein
MIYVFLSALAIWFFLKERIKENILVVALGALMLLDLVGVAQRYVNNDDFVAKRRMTQPFQETPVHQEILKDKDIFRVYDQVDGFDGARTSYFHQAISGYHAAKPAGMEDLFYFHISQGNIKVLNMLNVKYVIQQDEEGGSHPAINPGANGNAWFVKQLKEVGSADAEILALKDFDEKNEAIVNTSKVTNLNRTTFQTDSTSTLSLTDYSPNHLTYKSNNRNAGIAVFSEMYYPNGWQAYIDKQAVDHFKVNYVLRAMRVPSGAHTIEFKFEPSVVATGSKITLASSIIFGLIFLGGIGFSFWRSREKAEVNSGSP